MKRHRNMYSYYKQIQKHIKTNCKTSKNTETSRNIWKDDKQQEYIENIEDLENIQHLNTYNKMKKIWKIWMCSVIRRTIEQMQ